MKKLGIVITDGVGFRNFILSDCLAEAEKSFGEMVSKIKVILIYLK